ncbi:protein E6-like [Asparagus officinalis]|nr:protein E6-like [Asparagus officinalis]
MEPNKIPSTFTNPEFPTENYENEEKRNVNTYNTPFTFSDEEFRRYESKNVPSYSQYDKQQQQYGMSDTRLLENGKYFYDVNAERYGKGNTEEYGGGYEPTKGNTEEYDRGYEPTKENTETTYANEEGRDGYEYKKEMSRDDYEP